MVDIKHVAISAENTDLIFIFAEIELAAECHFYTIFIKHINERFKTE